MIERIKSGVPGFDKIISGGLITNSVNLLSGGTGTGKTIFCLQYLLNGAKELNEKGIYISFEETEDDLKSDVEGLGLNFKEAEEGTKFKKKLKSDVERHGLNFKELSGGIKFADDVKFVYVPLYTIMDFVSLLRENIKKFKPKRVVIDSISALAMPMENDFERRKQIFQVIETLKTMNCTSVLTSEIPTENIDSESLGGFSRYGIEEFLCDSVIVLHYAGIGGESDRAIRVVKMRRTNHIRGPVPMSIGRLGIKVSRKI